MGLSVASLNPISPIQGVQYAEVASMNYTVDNESEVSASYVESMEQVSNQYVDAASPVQYPNASVSPTRVVERSQEANAAYNAVAQRFDQTTGYNQFSVGQGYETVGALFDQYA